MFNALNSIRALIREDPVNAQIAVTKLSNLLRYSLKIEKSEMVPLEEEMATVCDYLALESIRFEERLRFNVDIDPVAKKIDIPPMMIQTLVENGIKHGISKRTSGGEIIINAILNQAEVKHKKTNGSGDREVSELYIQIINSGHIDEEALKNSTGFGIQNTKHRLNLLYGEKAFFSIKNSDGDKVIAELKIPAGG
jgi:LytS/YehU family sensor histidine kinase